MLTLILLLQASVGAPSAAPSDPVNMAVELLNPLKAYQEDLIVAGDVRVVDGTEILSLHGAKDERVLGVPRLVEITKGSVLTLRLVQTYLPAAETEFTVTDFNQLAFRLGFTYVLWESSCDAMNDDDHTCQTGWLVIEFLDQYGTVPESLPPGPEAWPTDDDEYVSISPLP